MFSKLKITGIFKKKEEPKLPEVPLSEIDAERWHSFRSKCDERYGNQRILLNKIYLGPEMSKVAALTQLAEKSKEATETRKKIIKLYFSGPTVKGTGDWVCSILQDQNIDPKESKKLEGQL